MDIQKNFPSEIGCFQRIPKQFIFCISRGTNWKFQNYIFSNNTSSYSKTCVKPPLSKRPNIGFQDQLLLNAGQKYCRMLQGEHSAILLTFIKLPYAIKIFVLSIFGWPFYTGFTVFSVQLLTQLYIKYS